MEPANDPIATSPRPPDVAHAEPVLSPVWTRRRPAWKLGLRAATASFGTLAPTLYLFYVRSGAISWRVALAIDVAFAVASGAAAVARPWIGRVGLGTRFGAMLESTAILPWFLGASLFGVLGLVGGIALSTGHDVLMGLTAGFGVAAAWSWGFTRWWDRRQRARAASASRHPRSMRR